MSSRCKVLRQRASGRREPRHMPSGQGVSGHISFGRSACLPDAKCHSKGGPDDASHGICLPDEECQGIFLIDGAHVFLTQSVMAKGVRTTRATANAFRTRSVRAYFLQTERMSSRHKLSWQRASGRGEQRHMPSGRGVSGHIPFGRSGCVPDAKCHSRGFQDDTSDGMCLPDKECQGIFLTDRAHVIQTQGIMAKGVRTTRAIAYAFRTRSVRAYFLRTERMSSRRKVSRQRASGRREPWHTPSGRGVSGHISYGRSACLPDAKCHCKGRPDDSSHGICLLDEDCQGIFLTDGAHVFQTQSVAAKGVQTMRAMAYAFRTRSVRAYFLQTERMSSRHKVSWQRASGRHEP